MKKGNGNYEERKGSKALNIILGPEPEPQTIKEVIEIEDLEGTVTVSQNPKGPKGGKKEKITLMAEVIAGLTPDQLSAYNLLEEARKEGDEKSQFKARKMLRKAGFYLSGKTTQPKADLVTLEALNIL